MHISGTHGGVGGGGEVEGEENIFRLLPPSFFESSLNVISFCFLHSPPLRLFKKLQPTFSRPRPVSFFFDTW